MKQFLIRIKENRWTARLLPVILLLLIVAFFSIATNGKFTSRNNLDTIFNQSLVVGVVATGAGFIFATGNINVAMGASTALTATLAAMIYMATGSLPLMFASAIVLGVLLMVFSALLSTLLRVKIMFVTIVMMVLLAALQAELVGGTNIVLPYAVIGPIQRSSFSLIACAVFFLICVALFHFTALGRNLKLLGANSVFSGLTGIKESNALLAAFAISGIGVGLGALMVIFRSGTITNTTCSSLNMDVVLALVLGGMPIVGGSRAKIYAGLLGALTVTVLNSGLIMLGVTSTLVQGVRGVLFLLLILSAYQRPDLLP